MLISASFMYLLAIFFSLPDFQFWRRLLFYVLAIGPESTKDTPFESVSGLQSVWSGITGVVISRDFHPSQLEWNDSDRVCPTSAG